MPTHMRTGLVKLKLSHQDMFTAANPHTKSPAQIQEWCLNPGPDTATSIPPTPLAVAVSPVWEASLATETVTLRREDKSLGGNTTRTDHPRAQDRSSQGSSWGIVPTHSQQRRAEACGAAGPISTGAAAGMPSVWPLQRKSVGLSWPRAGLWGIFGQQGAQRGWKALGSCS